LKKNKFTLIDQSELPPATLYITRWSVNRRQTTREANTQTCFHCFMLGHYVRQSRSEEQGTWADLLLLLGVAARR